MSPSQLLTTFILLFATIGYGQNRVFERPNNTGRSIFLDQGESQTLIAQEVRFGWDSTQVHLLSANTDMELAHLGGFRMIANLTWLNHATKLDDGVILGGANLAFTTTPYVLRMDFDGNVAFSNYFSNLEDGQDQIISTFVSENDLDIFTWSDNSRLSYYMLNGTIDGDFPSGLQVHAPEGIEFRTDDIAPTENDNEYLVVCQADTNSTLSHFLIVSRINSDGVLWSYIHDHIVSPGIESEFAFGLKELFDGNWMYITTYNSEFSQSRIVKMDNDGDVLWSKEYYLNGENLRLLDNYETSDNGLLQIAILQSTLETLVLKLDVDGDVQWSKKYVPSQTSAPPTGQFFKNDQNQLYSFNAFAIAEIDETFNSCDFQPHSGVSVSNVSFDIIEVSHETTEIVPEVAALPYQMREANLENSLMCLSTGIEETEIVEVDIYPNPTSSNLHVDLSKFHGVVKISILDAQGRLVLEGESHRKKIAELDVSLLNQGIYLIQISGETKWASKRFVKE